MPRAVYLQPGAVLGAYRVLAVHTPAPESRDRLYWVDSICCHTAMVRSHKVLVEGRRLGGAQCPRCAQATPTRGAVPSLLVGAVVGPVTIIALDQPLWRQVRWACCGAEETLSTQRLYVLRNRYKAGHEQVCGACARQRSWPKQQGPWMAAPARLPPGIVSAAIAWPRPEGGGGVGRD